MVACPCCGYLVLIGPSGDYDLCPICFWEDDPTQSADPTSDGGANHISLIEAQANYAAFGACDEHGRAHGRAVGPDDRRDPGWRPIGTASS